MEGAMDPPQPRRRPAVTLRRIPVLPVFAAVSFTAVLILLYIIARLSVEVVHGKKDPYRFEFGDMGVAPLLGEDRLFDVGVSIFAYKPINVTARPECSERAEGEWLSKSYRRAGRLANMTKEERELAQLAKDAIAIDWSLQPTACTLRYVPETEELWSGVIARNITLGKKRVQASVDFDIPINFLKPLRTTRTAEERKQDPLFGFITMGITTGNPDVYAVVSLIPHIEDLHTVFWYKNGLEDLPLIGKRLQKHAEGVVAIPPTEDEGNPEVTRRVSHDDVLKAYLHTMSVRVPLISSSHDLGDELFLATKVPIVLLKRTESITISTIKDRTERMIAKGCSMSPWGKRHRFLCPLWVYPEVGHWHSAYQIGKAGEPPGDNSSDRARGIYNSQEWKKRRYPPYLTAARTGPLDYRQFTVGNETHLRHSFEVKLSVIDQFRLQVLENNKRRHSPGRETAYLQESHDETQKYHALVGLAPFWRTALGYLFPLVAKYSRLAASAFTVLYWATRRTTAGISIRGTSLIIAGEMLRNATGSWDYYYLSMDFKRKQFWAGIWFILLFPEVLQLRLILPFTLKKMGNRSPSWRPSSWRLQKIPASARERRSGRLDLKPVKLIGLAAALVITAYAVYNHPIRLIEASHNEDDFRDTYRAQYPGSRVLDRYSQTNIGRWTNSDDLAYYHRYIFRSPKDGPVWRKFMLLPMAQAMLSTGQIAQLVMNYRSKTFAGNYALTCFFKVFALVSIATPFIARTAYSDGLYLAATAQVMLLLTEAAQALVCPRIEQEIEGEEMEM